jgi:hypothetical protein
MAKVSFSNRRHGKQKYRFFDVNLISTYDLRERVSKTAAHTNEIVLGV